jgi:hypothetical protein
MTSSPAEWWLRLKYRANRRRGQQPESDEDPTFQSRTGAYQPGHDATGALRVAIERCGS